MQRLDRHDRQVQRTQGAGESADGGGNNEHHEPGSGDVVAAGRRALFILAHGLDHRAERRRQHARHEPEGQRHECKHDVVLGHRMHEVQFHAEHLDRAYPHAAQAVFPAGPAVRLVEHVIDALRQCQRHHGEIDSPRADRQRTHQQTDRRRAKGAGRDRHVPRPAAVHDSHTRNITTGTEKRGVPEGKHAGIAEQQVEADRKQTEDKNVDRERLVGHYPRERDQNQYHRRDAVAGNKIGGGAHPVLSQTIRCARTGPAAAAGAPAPSARRSTSPQTRERTATSCCTRCRPAAPPPPRPRASPFHRPQ